MVAADPCPAHLRVNFAGRGLCAGRAAEFVARRDKRAIILIAQRLPPDCGLISTMYDELIALAHTDKAEEAKAIVETCMIEAMAELFPAVPVEVECAVCQNWGGKK